MGGVWVIVLRVADVHEDLCEPGLGVFAIDAIVPRVEDDGSVVDLEPLDFLPDVGVGHDDVGSLAELRAVDGAVEVAGQLLMGLDFANSDINDGLEEARSAVDVPHDKDASG